MMEDLELMSAAVNAAVSGVVFIGIAVMILAHWMF